MTKLWTARTLLAISSFLCVFVAIECGNCSIPAICSCKVEQQFNATTDPLPTPVVEPLPLSSSFTIKVFADICKPPEKNQSGLIDPTPQPKDSTPNITLSCTFADPLSNQLIFPSNLTNGSFYLTLNYPCSDPVPPSAKEYSTGSILLIIFFTGLFSYLILGMAVNYFMMGARSTEVIPNLGFWRDVPGLVKDGAVFIQNGFRVPQTDIYQRSPESYDAI